MSEDEDEDWFERALRDSGDDDESEVETETVADDAGGADGTTPDADSEDEGSLFDDDFASAFGDADPGGAAGAGSQFGDAGGGTDGSFGGTDSPFGAGADSPFDGGGAFGDGEFGMGSDTEEFGDEELDSDLPRVNLGVKGLDDMIRGGIPERSLMTVIGSAGTGKTTFGLQFLNRGLENGEQAIYITLEESRRRILDSAAEKGWEFDAYVEAGQLAIVDIDPVEMANNLTSIRSDLPSLVEDFGAGRLVLDSVSLLELMYEDRAKRRNEVYAFTRTLKESGVTTLLTSEAAEDNPYASRHGIVEYLTDAVFIMRYVRPSDFRETRLAIEIQKIRDANHSREMKPYEITDEGLNVYRQANIF